ncbi:Exostosin, GT47 domain [Dillenia turbinata]|uniref:Exostosin, GT47 domain n=1 Tax=Dillenia turbinata TaxID=194707 RepID=A0AAN8Z8K5_9MAGN
MLVFSLNSTHTARRHSPSVIDNIIFILLNFFARSWSVGKTPATPNSNPKTTSKLENPAQTYTNNLLILFLFTSRSLFSSCSGDSNYIAVTNRKCAAGMLYVYNFPPEFNSKLTQNCDDLIPGMSLCDVVLNDGLGPVSTGLDEVVPKNLVSAWYDTEQYSPEIIFHNRVLNHRCRTLDPEFASAFYMPFYARYALEKHLWVQSSASDRDRLFKGMLDWVKSKPYWNRSGGSDHFMMIGRLTWDYRRMRDNDWGSSFFYMPEMKNVTRLLAERDQEDAYEVGVPYPTGFHPRSDSEVTQWQEYVRTRERDTLFSFVGGTREMIKDDFRGMLVRHCKNESKSCRFVQCAGNRCTNGLSSILDTFLHSEFCLQPKGRSFTRQSIFECMVAGSIPVFFWNQSAYDQYEWHLPPDTASYSVFIHNFKVRRKGTSVNQVLSRYSREDIRRMREKVIEYIPKIVYAKPSEGLETVKDAFDVALDGVLKRFKDQKNTRYTPL